MPKVLPILVVSRSTSMFRPMYSRRQSITDGRQCRLACNPKTCSDHKVNLGLAPTNDLEDPATWFDLKWEASRSPRLHKVMY